MEEIISLLRYFQEGYSKREPEKIDEFMTKLFGNGENLVIMGTSLGEICLDNQECRELFSSDWQYWGDVSLDIENCRISMNGNLAWVFTTGTLLYSFELNEASYKRYLDFVKNYLNETPENMRRPDKFKLTEINWVLSHFLTPRDKQKRRYLWPLRVSFVLIREAERWFIKQIHFSLPNSYEFPDCRIDLSDSFLMDYRDEVKKLGSYFKKDLVHRQDVVNMLKNFSSYYLSTEKNVETLFEEYFTKERAMLIDTDSSFGIDSSSIIKQISFHRDNWSEIILNAEESIINNDGNSAWIITSGLIRRSIDEDKAFDMAAEYIKGQFNKDISDKDKLFNIRRVISSTIKETIKGNNYEFPFRFEAVLTKESEKWKFSYVQFSYPFNYILEGKYDNAVELEG